MALTAQPIGVIARPLDPGKRRIQQRWPADRAIADSSPIVRATRQDIWRALPEQ